MANRPHPSLHEDDYLNAIEAGIADYNQAFERILFLHAPTGRPSICKECGKSWPCPTTVAAYKPRQEVS